MPQVPYSPVPSVGPSQQATPGLNVEAGAQMFGGEIARSVGHFGKELEQAGNQIFQRAVALQEMQNDADVNDAYTKYITESAGLHTNFKSLEGKAAVDALPQYQADLVALRDKYSNSMKNPSAKHKFDMGTKTNMARSIFSGAEWAAAQQRKWSKDSSDASTEAEKNEVLHNPEDEALFNRVARNIEQRIREVHAPLGRYNKEQTDLHIQKEISSLALAQLKGLRNNPVALQNAYDAKENLLFGDDVNRAKDFVTNVINTNGAERIALEANSPDKKDWSFEERARWAEKRAREVSNDAVFQARVASATLNKARMNRAMKKEDDITNRDTVTGAIMGLESPQGIKPTTVEEMLQSNDRVKDAYDKLDNVTKDKVWKALEQNSKADYVMTPVRRRRDLEIREILGDPDRKAEALDLEIMSEELPHKTKIELFNRQQKIKVKPEEHPKVNAFVKDVSWMIPEEIRSNKKRLDEFKGLAQVVIEQYIRDNNGKAPKPGEESRAIASTMLMELRDPESSWWFRMLDYPDFWKGLGVQPGETKLFELTVPEAMKDDIKRDLEAKRGGRVADEEAAAEYRRLRYREAIEMLKKKGQEQRQQQQKGPPKDQDKVPRSQ